MAGPWARWVQFWFEPATATNLALCRVAFFAAILWLYRKQDFAAWGAVPRTFWRPVSFFKRLRLPAFSTETLGAMRKVWLVALGLSGMGLLTGLSTRLSFLLGAYLLGLPQNFGKIHHQDGMIVFVLGIMALARCADRFSLDRLLLTAAGHGNRLVPTDRRSGEYTWPIRLVWLLLSLAFFGAGRSKVKYSGRTWFEGESLANLLICNEYRRGRRHPPRLIRVVARSPLLCRVLTTATVAIEAAYPFALISRRARWVLVPSSIAMLHGFRVLVGPAFPTFIACSVFWVPWDHLHAWLSTRITSATRAMRFLPLPRREH